MGVQALNKKTSKQRKKSNVKNMNDDLDKIELTRFVKETAQQTSTEFDDLVSKINVSPFIRGDELKVLLSHTSATQRFENAVKSLGRTVLFDNLAQNRALLADQRIEFSRTNRDNLLLNNTISKDTKRKIKEFNEPLILKFLNDKVLLPLDPNLRLLSLDDRDPVYKLLGIRSEGSDDLDLSDNKISKNREHSKFEKAYSVVKKFIIHKQNSIRLKNNAEELQTRIKELEVSVSDFSELLVSEVRLGIDQIEVPMNEYFQFLQGDTSQKVQLEIDNDEVTGLERLHFKIDFAPSCEGVLPNGFQCNSHMHSFALSFRLASVKVLNPRIPLLVLNDIVTLYDVEYRYRVAGLLAKKFHDSQIILLTHDELFYQILIDKMDSNKWEFERIISFDPKFGPIFRKYLPTVEEIKSLWKNGHSAIHLIRRRQEKFARQLVMDLGIKMPVLSSYTTRNHNRADLFIAIAKYLEKLGLKVPKLDTVGIEIFQFFSKGYLENAGSHFQEEIYGSISIGDERARLKEYLKLENLFVCRHCGNARFKTKKKKMVCRDESCEEVFEFKESV